MRGVLTLLMLAAVALLIPGPASAKEAKPLSETQTVNQPVPDASAASIGVLESTINAGKKFKGLKIRDVNVTVQTTGSAAGAANNLVARSTAPNEATVTVFSNLGGQNVGPLTLDDESPLTLTGGTASSARVLGQPYIGTAQPGSAIGPAAGRPLWLMDNGSGVKGTWTLSIADVTGVGVTSTAQQLEPQRAHPQALRRRSRGTR